VGGSIIRRIVVGFGIVLVLALLIAVAGTTTLARARRMYSAVEQQALSDEALARDADVYFLRANQAYLRLLLKPDTPRWRTDRNVRLAGTFAAIALLRDSANTVEARRIWSQVDTLVRAWDEASGRAIAAAMAGRMPEAERIRATETTALSLRIDSTITKGVQSEVDQSKQMIADAQSDITTGSYVVLIGSLVTLLAGALIAWRVIRSVTRPLRESTSILATSSSEILAATSEQASGANESIAAVAQTAATVDQVAQTTEQAAQRARSVAEGAQRALEFGRNGKDAVDASILAMERVVEQAESMRAGVRALSEHAETIRGITATVDEIAERSNLLALNAAIEAARAGEEGRGFAIVAGEIRSLAEQSKKATVEVRGIVADIQRAAASAAAVAELGSQHARESARTVSEAGETIRLLGETMADASQAATQIAASAGQQATGMSQIRQAMHNIREVTQQNLIATQQTERAAQDLSQIGASFLALVGGSRKRKRHA
jgi:methyl-accepting chemotaxis protein